MQSYDHVLNYCVQTRQEPPSCRIRRYPTVGKHRIRRYPTVGNNRIRLSESDDIRCRKTSEMKGYHRFPTIGIPSDPTVGFYRILSDPTGSDGRASTWAVLYEESENQVEKKKK